MGRNPPIFYLEMIKSVMMYLKEEENLRYDWSRD